MRLGKVALVRIALLVVDNREAFREYQKPWPWFGRAPEALLQGFELIQGVEVHIVSCAQQSMISPSHLASNIHFHSLHVPKYGWLRTGYQGCIRAVQHFLKDLKPDLVHGQGTERESALCAVFSGYRNVITIHGNMTEIARSSHSWPGSFWWFAARLENYALSKTDGVFCNSAYTQILVTRRAKQCWLVPNALRAEYFAKIPPRSKSHRPKLLCVGTITPWKRPQLILEVCNRLINEGLQFELMFVGQCPQSTYGKQFLSSIHEKSISKWAGWIQQLDVCELIKMYDSADALIHYPSEEAFGLVAAEALSRNLMLFASNIGGIRDIALGVDNARLVDPYDSLELQTALRNWLKSGFAIPTSSAKVMQDRYHPCIITQKHIDIYRQLLAK